MIKSGLVAMAVIGCDCDAKMCEYIRTTEPQWSSVADCESDMRANVLLQHESYPLVVAVCRDVAEGGGALAGLSRTPASPFAGTAPIVPATDPRPSGSLAAGTAAPVVASPLPGVPTVARTPVTPALASPAADQPAREARRDPTWRGSAVAAASSIVAPLLANDATGSSTTDGAGRVTTVFRTESGLVSIRGKVSGALSTASRTALDTVGWLRAAVTPQWF